MYHEVTINNFTIIGREDQHLTRAIKEALFIRVNDPSLKQKHRQVPSASHMG